MHRAAGRDPADREHSPSFSLQSCHGTGDHCHVRGGGDSDGGNNDDRSVGDDDGIETDQSPDAIATEEPSATSRSCDAPAPMDGDMSDGNGQWGLTD